MTQSEILKIFEESGALLQGHFLLSSGLHSNQYLQCARVLEHPAISEKLARALAAKFKKDKINTVIGPAMGGIILAYELARVLKARALFTERESARMCLRRGFSLSAQDDVLVAEDVITTGRSVREVIDVVRDSGARLIGVGCIVERTKDKIDFGVRMENLIEIDIPTFASQVCPYCRDNLPLVKPGSRK